MRNNLLHVQFSWNCQKRSRKPAVILVNPKAELENQITDLLLTLGL